jgi:hypothetical protein
MAGTFDFKIDVNGARVVVARLPLTPDCADGSAIVAAIDALKDDLDAVANEMKAAVRRQARAIKRQSFAYHMDAGFIEAGFMESVV